LPVGGAAVRISGAVRVEARLVFAFAIASGCTCRGKGEDAAGGAAVAADPVVAAEPVAAADELRKADAPQHDKGRFDVDRVGFVRAMLGERKIDFAILPRTQNRVSFGTKPPLVLVDGYGSEDSKEHLRVHIQGVPADKWKGRTLVQTDDKSWLVANTYPAAAGTPWGGGVGRDEGVTVALDEVDPPTQLVSGTFSGPLRQAGGDAVIQVAGGTFRTVRSEP
jgi:hypothetical protein